jgi:hypothetical protein
VDPTSEPIVSYHLNKQRPFVFDLNSDRRARNLHDHFSRSDGPEDFKQNLRTFLTETLKIDQLEVSLSQHGVFGYLDHFSKPISVEDFLTYQGT